MGIDARDAGATRARAHRPRGRRAWTAAACAAWCAWLFAAAAAADCEAWPGEPAPLPRLSDSDPLRAEWAALRVKELAMLARRFEKDDPVRARQMWRRLLCMDPANDEALAGVMRARPVLIHRPPLVEAPQESPLQDPWQGLDAPLGLRAVRVPDPREEAAARQLRELRAGVGMLEEQIRGAHFDEALAAAPALRARLERAPVGATRSNLMAQTEVLTATAQLALGRADAADESLRRALAADPELSLDPITTPPKVMRAFEAVRAREGQ